MTNTELWRRRVKNWRASGASAADFCADEGLAASTLYQWAARLRRLDEERGDEDSNVESAEPRLLRVVRSGGSAETAARIEIVVGNVVVRVLNGVTPAALRVVLDVLESRGAA